MRKQAVTVLGSTGSIGKNTLDVIAQHPDRYAVFALAAQRSVDTLFEQCQRFRPALAVLGSAEAADQLNRRCEAAGLTTQVRSGSAALDEVAAHPDTDIVVAAIVGAAGLLSTFAAVNAGKRLLLANKESLVMSGSLLMNAAVENHALIMPVDSEHNAIFQCLPVQETGIRPRGIKKLLLTASGGPLRTLTKEQLSVVTPQQALAHPNWSMGPKISIDSATLMNKGLELIEACHLFNVDADDVEVVVHPQSIIHSMVTYPDGSVIAQLGQPDMRTPIAYSLAWPERITAGVRPLDFSELSGLHFEKPDTDRFPLLRLAFEAQARGDTAPAILNAANEVAVEAFLSEAVSFLQLSDIVEQTLSLAKISPANELSTIINADKHARDIASELIAKHRG